MKKTKAKIQFIESKFLLRKIFSNVNIRQKLELLNFNYPLQKKIGINIEDYKQMSGKYKIDKDGISKVYILGTDILIYEGGYLNGKKNGNSKQYDDNGTMVFYFIKENF